MKYYSAEAIMVADYYQFPKWLKNTKISSDAKLLYVYLFDRYRLSLKNGWVDKENRVYLICPRSEMQDLLGCAKGTAIKAAKSLEEAGLIEEKRIPNEANRIYLLMPSFSNVTEQEQAEDEKNDKNISNKETWKFKNWTSKTCTSKGSKSGLPEVQKLDPSNNYSSNNNKSNNYYSNDDDIDKILNVADESTYDYSVVVEEKKKDSFSSVKGRIDKSAECKEIEKGISDLNRTYSIYEDSQFGPFIEECADVMKEFEENHNSIKVPSLYRYSDISLCWIRNSEVYRTSEFISKAEKMLSKVINSFRKPEERIALSKLSRGDLEELLNEGCSYYDDFHNSNIADLQKWYASVLRSKIIENIT